MFKASQNFSDRTYLSPSPNIYCINHSTRSQTAQFHYNPSSNAYASTALLL